MAMAGRSPRTAEGNGFQGTFCEQSSLELEDLAWEC